MPEIEVVAGRQKAVFTKHGQLYTRKGYDLRVTIADKFSRKTDLLGETESRTIERLIEAYCAATGWEDRVKSAPFETDNRLHVKQATMNVVRSDSVTIPGLF